MTEDDTLGAILDFVRTEADVAPDDPDFGSDADLFDLGYVDSFSIVRLIAMVADRFGVDLADADFYAPGLRTPARIAAHIEAAQARA